MAQPMHWRTSLRIVLARCGGTDGHLAQPGCGEDDTTDGNMGKKCKSASVKKENLETEV